MVSRCEAGRRPLATPPLPCVTMAPAPDTGAAGAIELSDRQLADYRSDGFVVVEDLVSAAELRALQQVLGAAAAPAGAVHVAAAASVAPPHLALDRRDGAAGHARLRCRSPGPRRRSRLRARRSLPTEAPRLRRRSCVAPPASLPKCPGGQRLRLRAAPAPEPILSPPKERRCPRWPPASLPKRRREPRPPASSPPKLLGGAAPRPVSPGFGRYATRATTGANTVPASDRCRRPSNVAKRPPRREASAARWKSATCRWPCRRDAAAASKPFRSETSSGQNVWPPELQNRTSRSTTSRIGVTECGHQAEVGGFTVAGGKQRHSVPYRRRFFRLPRRQYQLGGDLAERATAP